MSRLLKITIKSIDKYLLVGDQEEKGGKLKENIGLIKNDSMWTSDIILRWKFI